MSLFDIVHLHIPNKHLSRIIVWEFLCPCPRLETIDSFGSLCPNVIQSLKTCLGSARKCARVLSRAYAKQFKLDEPTRQVNFRGAIPIACGDSMGGGMIVQRGCGIVCYSSINHSKWWWPVLCPACWWDDERQVHGYIKTKSKRLASCEPWTSSVILPLEEFVWMRDYEPRALLATAKRIVESWSLARGQRFVQKTL